MNKEFGSTYLCNRLLHRWLGGRGRWLRVVVEVYSWKIPILYHLYCCAGDGWWWWCRMLWCSEDLWLFYASLLVCGWWRTYDCFMPHCNDGLMIAFATLYFFCGRFDIFPCHIAFMGCCVGSLALSLGSSTGVSFAWHDVAQAFRRHIEQCACFFCCPFIHILSS